MAATQSLLARKASIAVSHATIRRHAKLRLTPIRAAAADAPVAKPPSTSRQQLVAPAAASGPGFGARTRPALASLVTPQNVMLFNGRLAMM